MEERRVSETQETHLTCNLSEWLEEINELFIREFLRGKISDVHLDIEIGSMSEKEFLLDGTRELYLQ